MKIPYDKIQENDRDIDTTIHCECGTNFNMCLDSIYRCPKCGQLYEGRVIIYTIDESDREDTIILVGKAINYE